MPHKQKFFYIQLYYPSFHSFSQGSGDYYFYTKEAYNPALEGNIDRKKLIPCRGDVEPPKFTEIQSQEIMKSLGGTFMCSIPEENIERFIPSDAPLPYWGVVYYPGGHRGEEKYRKILSIHEHHEDAYDEMLVEEDRVFPEVAEFKKKYPETSKAPRKEMRELIDKTHLNPEHPLVKIETISSEEVLELNKHKEIKDD